MVGRPAEEVSFGLDDSRFQESPAEVMSELRQRCPVHFSKEPSPYFTISRGNDVVDALRDEKIWSSRYGPGLAYNKAGQGVLVSSDPPKHTRERVAISRIFQPSAINELEDDIRSLTNRLIDGVVEKNSCDLIREYAMPIPLTVMCWLLGTPTEDIELFRSWVLPMAEAVAYAGGREANDEIKQAYANFFEYFGNHITRRAESISRGDKVADDLLTQLLTVERDNQRLTNKEILGFCQFLLVAGSETTTLLIGNAIYRLLEHPDQLRQALNNVDLFPNAIEESLRYDAPVHGLFRTNTCPITLHNIDIPTNSKVYMLFGSANRDPELWVNPDEFDITRELNDLKRHAAFGVGTHYCLGAPLARLEATIALQTLFTRLPSIQLNGNPKSVSAEVLHGFEELPVRWGS